MEPKARGVERVQEAERGLTESETQMTSKKVIGGWAPVITPYQIPTVAIKIM